MTRVAAAAAATAAVAVILLQVCTALYNDNSCPPKFKVCGNATREKPCVSNEELCDGKNDCPDGSDESGNCPKVCSSDFFSCSQSNTCISKTRRCDGRKDCKDGEDEDSCPTKIPKTHECRIGEFECKTKNGKSHCLPKSKICDQFNDCGDGSDEKNCPCLKPHFFCDGGETCVTKEMGCNNQYECFDKTDEVGCRDDCLYINDIFLKNGKCVSPLHVCDGVNEADYFDEICPTMFKICNQTNYWTCDDRLNCIHKNAKCDGRKHCDDGSDERRCSGAAAAALLLTAAATTKDAANDCKTGQHLCKHTKKCVTVEKYCNMEESCPFKDSELEAKCQKLKESKNPCLIKNGGCEHKCSYDMNAAWLNLHASCSCKQGFRVAKSNSTRCEDIDECAEKFGICSQFCINTIGSFKCKCKENYILNGNSCLATKPAAILIATDSEIMEMVARNQQKPKLLLNNLKLPTHLTVDSANNYLYFYSRDGSLRRLRLQIGAKSEILLNNTLISALAIDWWRNILFFVENRGEGDHKDLMAMDLSSGRIAHLMQLACPRSLAASPQTGQLFVSLMCGQSPGVYAIDLHRAPLQPAFLTVGGSFDAIPGYLTIDTEQQPSRIYWADTFKERIYSSHLDGSQVRQHWPQPQQEQHNHGAAQALAVFEDELLWVDNWHGKLRIANKFSVNKNSQNINLPTIQSIALVHQLLQPQPKQQQRQAIACQCGNVCLARATDSSSSSSSSSSKQPMCFCNRNQKLNNLTKHCESESNSFDSVNNISNRIKSSPMDGRVGSVAGVVIGALSACVLLLALLAAVCVRRSASDKQSESALQFGNDSFDYFVKAPGYSRLAKANSQTTLNGDNAASRY